MKFTTALNNIKARFVDVRFAYLLIAFGILLRLRQLLVNRAFWLDEVLLALNIVEKSYAELLPPLDYNQVAPVGFVWIVKFLVIHLGQSEWVFRLVPFIAAIVAIILFYRISTHILTRKGMLIATGLIVFSVHLVHYSYEFKQYSVDVFASCILFLMIIHVDRHQRDILSLVWVGITGAIILWFSHPSVLVMAALGLVWIIDELLHKKWSHFIKLWVAFLPWVASFMVFYVISLHTTTHNEWMNHGWRRAFVPLQHFSLGNLRWFLETFFNIFKNPLGSSLPGIGALAFVIGCFSLHKRNRLVYWYTITPMLITILVSGLQKYPFHGRLLLFLTPFFLLLIAEGTAKVMAATREYRFMGETILLFLFLHPILSAGSRMVNAHVYPQVRDALQYIRDHRQKEDEIYVYYQARHTVGYYGERYGVNPETVVNGIKSRDDWDQYRQDLAELDGSARVWLFFSHVCTWRGVNEERLFVHYLDQMGQPLDKKRFVGASIYLYDLTALPRDSLQPESTHDR